MRKTRAMSDGGSYGHKKFNQMARSVHRLQVCRDLSVRSDQERIGIVSKEKKDEQLPHLLGERHEGSTFV